MKRTILSVAIGSLLALPAFATYAQNCEIDAGNLPKDVQCTKTREQVRAELIAAQRAGDVIVDGEIGTTAGAMPMQSAGITREQVRAELIAAQRAGDVIVDGEMGTQAGQLYARAGETYPVSATSPHYVFINLGTASNDLAVYPSELTLKAGVVYQFVVSNPSTDAHVLAAPELAASANTTQLTRVSTRPRRAHESVSDPTATLSKGMRVLPGEMLEWTFTPTKVGRYKFGCESRAHAAAGMFSTVTVTL